MEHKHILFLLLLFPFYSFAQLVSIKGNIVNQKDSTAIPRVSVMNHRTFEGIISTSKGYFEITVEKGDSIRFSAIGFNSYTLSINENISEGIYIYLTETTYELHEVIIWPYANKYEFRKAFNDIQPLEGHQVDLNLYNPLVKSSKVNEDVSLSSTGTGLSLNGGLTYLYNKYSRTGKEKRAYAAILVKDNQHKKVELKYNKELVKRVTGVKEDSEATSLIEYCCLADEFILTASDYELVLAISNCYTQYVK